MGKVFGYPVFDENGEKILTTYDNEYSEMRMDIRVYRMKKGGREKLPEKRRGNGNPSAFGGKSGFAGTEKKHRYPERMYSHRGHGACISVRKPKPP